MATSVPDISAGLQPAPKPDISAGMVPQLDPPPNYSLAAAPPFLKDGLPMDKVSVSAGDTKDLKDQRMDAGKNTAYVSPADPMAIRVMRPENMTQSTLNHELTHVYQDSLPGVQFAQPDVKDPYNYGGADGLIRDQASGKKITDYSNEQIAKMIQDHTEKTSGIMLNAKLGLLQPGEAAEYTKWQGAIAPVIHQLAALGGNKRSYTAHPVSANAITDLPEMSDQSIDISAGLKPNVEPVTSGVVKTGSF